MAGERSGLFFEIVRLAQKIKPKFIFIENVPAITSRGGLTVAIQIAEMGYDCRWCVISAASVGALHRRDRWFLLAYSNHNGSSAHQNWGSIREKPISVKINKQEKDGWQTERTASLSSHVANTKSQRSQKRRLPLRKKEKLTNPISNVEYGTWDEEPESKFELAGMANGLQDRTHRIKALGNAVVPAQAREAFMLLMGLK